jgi:hypothetical protein
MTVISTLIRQFCLPNPFECFGDSSILINWIAEPIIHVVAYVIVGTFYARGSAPFFGSLFYLITYAMVVGVLWMFGIFSFAWWWVLIIVVAITALIYGVKWLKERFFNG